MVINPYTFLPLGEVVDRARPHGHRTMGESRLSGSFTVTLTAQSPVLIGPLKEHGASPPTSADGQETIIPGSSLAGAVRAVHEAMNNSCLRIFDGGYRAVHRQAVSPKILADTRARKLRMAIVCETSAAGLPTRVALCDKVIWVPWDRFGFRAQTGMGVELPENPPVDNTSRPGRQLLDPHGPKLSESPDSRWRVLVTDTKPRQDHTQLYHSCGRQELPPHDLAVPEEVQAALARAIETSSDLHGDDVGPTDYVNVEHRGHLIGRRLKLGRDTLSFGAIPQGTPVWVRIGQDASGADVIEAVQLSLAWRRTSTSTALDRLPEAARPCTDPGSLCPSCRVFGSAGADDGNASGPSAQNSYRGHVRFVDVTAKSFTKDEFLRAPLMSPKPTAGQFYLINGAAENSSDLYVPTAQWDSPADEPATRKIRGRKFYWRTHQGDTGFPVSRHRGRHFDERNTAMTEMVTVLGVGSRFETIVSFDNLTPAQVGSLLAAIDPSRVLGGKCVISVGGGRPFGWGAVRGEVSKFTAHTAMQRYAGLPGAPAPAADACVAAYRTEMESRGATGLWTTLAKLLTLNPPGVQDSCVWYPPNPAPRHRRGSQEHDEGYSFWQGTSGIKYATKPAKPLKSLPDPAVQDQNIPKV